MESLHYPRPVTECTSEKCPQPIRILTDVGEVLVKNDISHLTTIDLDNFGWIIFCGGRYPVHCRIFCRIPGLSPLGTSRTFPGVNKQNFLQTLQNDT